MVNYFELLNSFNPAKGMLQKLTARGVITTIKRVKRDKIFFSKKGRSFSRMPRQATAQSLGK